MINDRPLDINLGFLSSVELVAPIHTSILPLIVYNFFFGNALTSEVHLCAGFVILAEL